MASATERLIQAIRDWSSENGRSEDNLIHWIELYLGWPYAPAGVNPDLGRMTPLERSRRPAGEHWGHPTIEQLEDRLNTLRESVGMWEPFLVCSIAQCLADELDRLADAPEVDRGRAQFAGDLDSFAADPEKRMRWVRSVRRDQGREEIPMDDWATDTSFDEFVAKAKERLQPLTPTEIHERSQMAESWRRLAVDLLDFRTESHRALTEG